MSEREAIKFGDQRTWVHVRAMTPSEQSLYSPATHYGVCVTVTGIKEGDTFKFDGVEWKILSCWDEARAKLNRHQPESMLSEEELSLHRSRLGKFTDMLLIEADSSEIGS